LVDIFIVHKSFSVTEINIFSQDGNREFQTLDLIKLVCFCRHISVVTIITILNIEYIGKNKTQ